MTLSDIVSNVLAVAIVVGLVAAVVYQLERTNRRHAAAEGYVGAPHQGADTSQDRDLARHNAELQAVPHLAQR